MNISSIQWCDTTVNPIMGCAGCELFPAAPQILRALDAALASDTDAWKSGMAQKLFTRLCATTYDAIPKPHPAMQRHVTTTNIWHLRNAFTEAVIKEHGLKAGEVATRSIEEQVTCYAAKLHLNKGASLVNPTKVPHKGYAPVFSKIYRGEDYRTRVPVVAKLKDLLSTRNERTPWKDDLPRMVFVSDMGDAFSRKEEFEYLKKSTLEPIRSEAGQRHLWLWLTKRPHIMKEFAAQIGGFPANVCAMTTLTSPNAENLKRLADLKQIPAAIRGLSIEPLWERIPPEHFDLTGIDWVIVGGESGSQYAREFPVEWAEELRDHCRASGVAFFCKQLGRNPTYQGKPVKLADSHGGKWDEWLQYSWGEGLRVREFPRQFHEYRQAENTNGGLRPVAIPKSERKRMAKQDTLPTMPPEQIERFEELDKIVRRGTRGMIEASIALEEIRRERLYRGRFRTFEEYCNQVHNMSRQYANRLIAAGQVYHTLETIVSKTDGGSPVVLPRNELQLSALKPLSDPALRWEAYKEALGAVNGDPDRVTAELIREKVSGLLPTLKKREVISTPAERLRAAEALVETWRQQLVTGGSIKLKDLVALESLLRR